MSYNIGTSNLSPVKSTVGQLDYYRRQASFKCQSMQLAIEDPERTAIKVSELLTYTLK